MVKIAPAIISADFWRLGEQVKAVEEAGADMIHVDVMDGHFVPNITMGLPVVRALKGRTKLPIDVHVMMEKPDGYIKEFAKAGASIITVHAEACPHLHKTLQHIREQGVKAGVAINPATDLHVLNYVLDDLDLILVMSVNPGFLSQKFIDAVLLKIKILHKMVEGRKIEIEVDGGLTPEIAPKVVKAGATVLVAGTAIFGQPDAKEALMALRHSTD